ncbi:hypothetical protein [Cypionkella aquatica]|uniref:hypothetical protein n=1 Tax=Cypionkella aquatica TaxID=1756042 RepID=UPI0024E08DEB|nr:hypothetical protein [Cypionkella aquatica]
MKPAFLVFAVMFLVSCVDGYERPPKTSDEKAMAASCQAEGGQFARTGIAAQMTYCKKPEQPAKDAGKSCSDGSQCETQTCLAATKTCAPVVNRSYCEPILERGETINVLCAD